MTWYPLDENHLRTEKERADLRLSLLGAVIWATGKADLSNPTDCLRTDSFRPYIFNDNRRTTVQDVVHARHRELVETGRIPDVALNTMSDEHPDVFAGVWPMMPADLGHGKLLVWERDLTIDDGLGEFVTKGYLDMSDMPPWDTWVAYVSPDDDEMAKAGYLISFVPSAFVPWVGEAVEGNVYGALYWLAGTSLLVSRILSDTGWLR